MSNKWFYGIEGIEFIWRGTQSDPLIEYKGKQFNYWDLEDAMWEDYCEAVPNEDENGFAKWMHDNSEAVKCYLDDWIWSMEANI